MNTTTQDLNIDNFTEVTGFRFRVSRNQKARIDANTITREQAFQEFLERGGLEELQKRSRPEIPDSVYLEPGLTLENFSERVKASIGIERRFRVSRDQKNRIADGSLTREGALAEIVAAKIAAASTTVSEETNEQS